jgi:predicted aldo/keto reductase-like oxidoreductase
MTEYFIGEHIGKLGYGNMRLPRVDGEIDTVTINKMIDSFLGHGFNYFDTAYIYEGSEEVLREALVKRHPRESFKITTKISLMDIEKPEGMQEQVDTSLKRLGTDYVDFYFLHGLSGPFIKKADEFDAWGFLRKLKATGVARHIGFSFHGTTQELDELLTKHPEMELVQIQLNYLDWENPEVKSREMYEIIRRHNKPISVMEPCKGGWLASEESEVAKLLRGANPDASVASWAMRFVLEHEGILTILSGMANLEQVEDNARTFESFTPLSAREHEIIKQAIDIINATPTVGCTGCGYCVKSCPKKIMIPAIMNLYSSYLVYHNLEIFAHIYSMMSSDGVHAGQCVKCGACEAHCPQHLGISDIMAKAAALVGKNETAD